MVDHFNLTVITYHYVRDVAGTEFPYLKTLAVADFERQLDFLQKKYAIISWSLLADFLTKGAPFPKNACLLTFDDGTKDHYENVFPRLTARGLSGLFFAIARDEGEGLKPVHVLQLLLGKLGYERLRELFEKGLSPKKRAEFLRQEKEYLKAHPEGKFGEIKPRAFRKVIQSTFLSDALPVLRVLAAEHLSGDAQTGDLFYLSRASMQEMVRGGMFFGGHGKRHEYLTLMADSDIQRELFASREFLKSIHSAPHAFNYPYGIYDDRTVALVREAGFAAAFATDNKGPEQERQFELHRLDATLFNH